MLCWSSGTVFSGDVPEDRQDWPRLPVIVSGWFDCFPLLSPGSSSSSNWSHLFSGMSSLPQEQLKLHVLHHWQLTAACIWIWLQKRSTVSTWTQIDSAGCFQNLQLAQVHMYCSASKMCLDLKEFQYGKGNWKIWCGGS